MDGVVKYSVCTISPSLLEARRGRGNVFYMLTTTGSRQPPHCEIRKMKFLINFLLIAPIFSMWISQFDMSGWRSLSFCHNSLITRHCLHAGIRSPDFHLWCRNILLSFQLIARIKLELKPKELCVTSVMYVNLQLICVPSEGRGVQEWYEKWFALATS